MENLIGKQGKKLKIEIIILINYIIIKYAFSKYDEVYAFCG